MFLPGIPGLARRVGLIVTLSLWIPTGVIYRPRLPSDSAKNYPLFSMGMSYLRVFSLGKMGVATATPIFFGKLVSLGLLAHIDFC